MRFPRLWQELQLSTGIPPVFLFVSAFLVNMILSRLVALEREQIGLLKALGYGRWVVASHYMKLVVVISLVGVLIGFAAGTWLGQGLTRLVATTVSELYYNVSVSALHLDAVALLGAIGLGVLATLLATLVPAWHAARTPPLTTLSRFWTGVVSSPEIAPKSANTSTIAITIPAGTTTSGTQRLR